LSTLSRAAAGKKIVGINIRAYCHFEKVPGTGVKFAAVIFNPVRLVVKLPILAVSVNKVK
jgi:hypothetical protein